MTARPSRRRAPELTVADGDRSFVVSFGEPVRVASWAISGGGLRGADHVVWVEVRDEELGPGVDAREFLAARLGPEGLTRAVALLTSRRVATRVDVVAAEADVTARAIVTVGLGNALRAGDPPWRGAAFGTINVLAYVDVPLTDEGLLEANAIATEAKCAALFDARVASRRSGKLATGTGTDCTIAACPLPVHGERRRAYAGKYTAVGAAVGAAVERAVGIGIREWRAEASASASAREPTGLGPRRLPKYGSLGRTDHDLPRARSALASEASTGGTAPRGARGAGTPPNRRGE